MDLRPYDRAAIAQIHTWKNPKPGRAVRFRRAINWPLSKAGDLVLSTPMLGDALRRAMEGLTGVCSDLAQWSVRPEAIYADFRKQGYEGVRAPSDIHALTLEDIDKVCGWLGAKYKSLALGEGAATGAAGLLGIAVDVPSLVLLNLRAIGEYATYCGFDLDLQAERLFALNVLGLASSPTDKSKRIALAQLVRIARDVANRVTWTELEKQVFVQVIQQISKAVGVRLTKAKLAQAVPFAGAVVGGGFNAYLASRVCDAAFYLYRERHLARMYGADIIEVTVEPAQGFDPGYPEAREDTP